MGETKPAIPQGQLEGAELEEVTNEIFQGNKLAAVKLFKETRGCSLLEAKEFVEQLTDRLRQESPEKFQARSSASGCASTVLMVILGALGMVAVTTLLS